jgi:hypothetical protein
LGIAGAIAAMTSAMERGDIDEASRQGAIAGPAALEAALASPARETVLGAIAAAPASEGRAELLPALASAAGRGDRRTAIPAATAARTIARDLGRAGRDGRTADDLDPDDAVTWRALFASLAANPNRFIEVRTLALDTVVALADVTHDSAIGFDLAAALADPDPAYRAIALDLVPRPTPAAAYEPLANAIKTDADDAVVRRAAAVLCGDDPDAVRPLLGSQGLDRIKKLVGKLPARDARRCLAR